MIFLLSTSYTLCNILFWFFLLLKCITYGWNCISLIAFLRYIADKFHILAAQMEHTVLVSNPLPTRWSEFWRHVQHFSILEFCSYQNIFNCYSIIFFLKFILSLFTSAIHLLMLVDTFCCSFWEVFKNKSVYIRLSYFHGKGIINCLVWLSCTALSILTKCDSWQDGCVSME